MEWKCGESWSDVGRINFAKMGEVVDSSGSLILSEGNCQGVNDGEVLRETVGMRWK